MDNLRFCEHCYETKRNTLIPIMFFGNLNKELVENFFAGYLYGIENSKWTDNICPFCENKLRTSSITSEELIVLGKTSNYNRQFLDAMVSLKEKDIIEYELKMSQFRNQVNSQKQSQVAEDKVYCPKCSSSSIITGQKGFTLLTGFLGSNKTVNRCGNCGYSWSPK